MRLRLGYSPCPNDTFIFHALVHGLVADGAAPPLTFDVTLDDVEAMNRLADEGELDVAKISYHAYGYLADRWVLLPAGGALGEGVGPLVVAREPDLDLAGRRIAIPGGRTTANLLLKLWRPAGSELVELRYDRIMPAVVAGEVDAGLIIHESRFTYPSLGLHALVDLGSWWEREVGELVPLGAIAMRRELGAAAHARVTRLIRASLEHAWAHPEASAAYVAQHAQEMEPAVRQQHIDLYVNGFSLDVGERGAAAARTLLAMGHERGLFAPVTEPIYAVV
ncbi:MAG: 1,4-dihydroxy-6-naphthoate synthase [Deinococcales bacterium]|nr:1,4-dihydroxy-6-naphthoate synthase [Deinococcales bacterium]